MALNSQVYNQIYQNALQTLQAHQAEQAQRTKRVNQLYNISDQLREMYQAGLSNAQTAAPVTSAASQGTNVGYGAGLGSDAAIGTSLGAGAGAAAGTAAASSLITPTTAASSVPSIAASGQGVYSTLMGAQGVTGSAAGSTAGATGTAGSAISGPLAGAAIALTIASAQPGSWLFNTKRFLYDLNEKIQTNPVAQMLGGALGPTPVYQGMKKYVFDPMFGDPNAQQAEIDRSRALKALTDSNARTKRSMSLSEEG